MENTQLQPIHYDAPQYQVEQYGDVIEGEAAELELSELDYIEWVDEAIGWPPYTCIIRGYVRNPEDDGNDWVFMYLSTLDPRTTD